MNSLKYKNQLGFLLQILPHIATEECFALHGGTGINLFVRNMPRFSVDIDLTYLPIEDRPTTLYKIAEALTRIKVLVQGTFPRAQILDKSEGGKLIIRSTVRDDSKRFRWTVWGDRLAKITFWMKAAPVYYPSKETFEEALSRYGKLEIRPLYEGTPFNNYLIVLQVAKG